MITKIIDLRLPSAFMLSIKELYRVRVGIMKQTGQGFTMIELMIVVAIIGFLSMVSIPSFLRFLSKAKRAEAYMNLGSLYMAQKAYWAEHGTYASLLNGPQSLGWKPEGYTTGGSNERFNYTYGFNNGQEGQHYFTGKLLAPQTALGNTNSNQEGFVIGAVGDIDGDGQMDLLTVNQFNDIKIVNDDLA